MIACVFCDILADIGCLFLVLVTRHFLLISNMVGERAAFEAFSAVYSNDGKSIHDSANCLNYANSLDDIQERSQAL